MKNLLTLSLLVSAMVAQAAVPTVSLSSPASGGTGDMQQFTIKTSSSAGTSNILYTWAGFTNGGSLVNACVILFYQTDMTARLLNDAGNAWGAPVTVGDSNAVLENARCKLPALQMNHFRSGNDWYFTFWAFPFKPGFGGLKTIMAFSSSITDQWTGQVAIGTWNVPGQQPAPTITSLTPTSSSTASTTYSVTATDLAGASDLQYISGGVGPLGSPNGCTWIVYRSGGKLLMNDAGNNWISTAPFRNAQCEITGDSFISNGNNGTAGITITAQPGFSGVKAINAQAVNNANAYTISYNLSNWTIPVTTPTYDRASFTAFVESDGARLGVDMMTNAPMYLEDAAHPLPTINLDTINGDNPSVIVAGTMATVDIRNAKPSTQVWIRGYGFDPISHTLNGDPESDEYFLPDPQSLRYSATIWPSSGELFPGGWLAGTTDASGHFTFNFKVGTPFGDNAIAVYVGNETVNSQVGLDGVTRQNYNASLNPVNYFGAVTFFTTDTYNSGLPNPFYVLPKGQKPGPKSWSQKLIDSCQKAHPVSTNDHIACIEKGLENPQIEGEQK